MSLGELQTLYVGLLDQHGGSTATQRMWALRDIGPTVDGVNWDRRPGPIARVTRALRRRLFNRMGDATLHCEVLHKLTARRYDALWVDKSPTLMAKTLRDVRRAHPSLKIIGYSPDDMMNPDNRLTEFVESLSYFDVFFTTKTYNVAELRDLGCPRTEFIGNAFHPALHRPIDLSPEEKRKLCGAVGFIGGPERDRAERMAWLAAQGISVRVWGDRWDQWKRRLNAEFDVAGLSLYGEMYPRIVCAFDINLCFLRKVNRDLQTTRSIEVPACGAFMLAERTTEHLELFEEGKEAEFFESDAELLDKCRYYLAHPDERRRIAAAGRERCIRSGYSNQERMRSMLKAVDPAWTDEPAAAGSLR